MAGEEDCHRFITQLKIGHSSAVAFLIARFDEHRKQVAMVFAASATVVDDAIDRSIEAVASFAKTANSGERQFFEETCKGKSKPVKHSHSLGQCITDLIRFRFDISVKERLARDGKCQPR